MVDNSFFDGHNHLRMRNLDLVMKKNLSFLWQNVREKCKRRSDSIFIRAATALKKLKFEK